MFRILAATLLLSIASPVLAQMTHHEGSGDDHAAHDMDGHDHAEDAHADHVMSDEASMLLLADKPELAAAIAAGGEPIVAKVLGAVCDFCALAMNKTFGKRDEVAAVYVDLDAKTLNLVLKPGATMDDETVRNVVKKSGYKVDAIVRGESLTRA